MLYKSKIVKVVQTTLNIYHLGGSKVHKFKLYAIPFQNANDWRVAGVFLAAFIYMYDALFPFVIREPLSPVGGVHDHPP